MFSPDGTLISASAAPHCGEEDKADRGRGGKTISGNGQAWSSAGPRGRWRKGKMEKTGCKIICGGLTTFAVKGLMMMITIIIIIIIIVIVVIIIIIVVVVNPGVAVRV